MMKVRRRKERNNGEFGNGPFDVIEESPSYYIAHNPSGPNILLLKASHEPVPTERWADVTDRCEIGAAITNNVGMSNSWKEWQFTHNDKVCNSDYRLKKVQRGDYMPSRHCFIVEKKEPV